jgi:hypothetical protein
VQGGERRSPRSARLSAALRFAFAKAHSFRQKCSQDRREAKAQGLPLKSPHFLIENSTYSCFVGELVIENNASPTPGIESIAH